MGPIVVGVDIGQKVDPTAVAVLEVEERPVADPATPDAPAAPERSRTEDYYIARYLERLSLGVPYPRVAERLAGVLENLGKRATAEAAIAAQATGTVPPTAVSVKPTIWLDATGVGQPVVDLLKAAGVRVTPIYFNHGDRIVKNDETGAISLGKALLVSQLQVLLQSKRLLLPKTAEAQALARELEDYEIRVDEDANDRYGAFKVGTHDDLVTALGLAVMAGHRRRRITRVGPPAMMSPSKWRGIGENGQGNPTYDSLAAAEQAHAEQTRAREGQHAPTGALDRLSRPSKWRIG